MYVDFSTHQVHVEPLDPTSPVHKTTVEIKKMGAEIPSSILVFDNACLEIFYDEADPYALAKVVIVVPTGKRKIVAISQAEVEALERDLEEE